MTSCDGQWPQAAQRAPQKRSESVPPPRSRPHVEELNVQRTGSRMLTAFRKSEFAEQRRKPGSPRPFSRPPSPPGTRWCPLTQVLYATAVFHLPVNGGVGTAPQSGRLQATGRAPLTFSLRYRRIITGNKDNRNPKMTRNRRTPSSLRHWFAIEGNPRKIRTGKGVCADSVRVAG